jgi:hypothetical protein
MGDYKINAGKCTKCGNYKTWDFKVENPATGKMMPGHVDKNGNKLGDGDCPEFSKNTGDKKPADKKDEKPKTKTKIPQKPVNSGDAARDTLGVPVKTDLTPIVQELGKIVIVLQDIHERFDTSIKVVESMNMKMKDLVDAFQVSRSPEVDESLTAVIENVVDEKLGMFKQRTEAGIEALKEDIKDMKKELKKLGKK